MLSKTLLFAFLSATAAVVSASPPGCLLGAINEYSKPSDIKAVCSEKDITSNVSKKCNDDTQDALNALADICNGAGVKICTFASFFPLGCAVRLLARCCAAAQQASWKDA